MTSNKCVAELVKNYELINQSVAKHDDKRIRYLLARMFVQQDTLFDIDKYNELDTLIKKKSGFFSHLDRSIRHSLAGLLLLTQSDQPHSVTQLFEEYQLLKEHGFKSSVFTYFSAYLVMKNTEAQKKSEIRDRAFSIYQDLKAEHPILTYREDYVSCVTLAQTAQLSALEVTEINDISEYYFEMFIKLGFKKNDNLQFAAATATSLIGMKDDYFVRQMERVLDELRGWEIKIKPLQYTGLVILSYLTLRDKSIQISELTDYLAVVDASVNLYFEKDFKNTLALSLFVQNKANSSIGQDLTDLVVTINLLMIQEQLLAVSAITTSIAVATTH